MKPSTIIRRAACLLREVGFTKRRLVRRHPQTEEVVGMCAFGALYYAAKGNLEGEPRYPDAHDSVTTIPAYQVAVNALDKCVRQMEPFQWSVPYFNDHHSKEDVVRLFDNMAEVLEKEGR